MDLPFTQQQFLDVFRSYNLAVFPAQIVAFAAALVCLLLALKARGSRIVSALLAALWLWIGVAYHLVFFTAINPAAYVFGGLFIIQGLILFSNGTLRGRIEFDARGGASAWMAAGLAVVALAIYPLLGVLFGHVYPATPTFGLPCPTTIFTLGMLAASRSRIPWRISAIPVVWALIGTSAAAGLGIYQDFALLLSATVLVVALLAQRFREKRAPSPRRAIAEATEEYQLTD